MPKGSVHDNVFSLEEIAELNSWLDQQPFSNHEKNFDISNKNLDYHLEHSPAYKIIRPKLNRLLGSDHQFATGAYKECRSAYTTHIDHYPKHQHLYNFTNVTQYDTACLIPLVEGPEFTTVLFDVFSDSHVKTGDPVPVEWLTVDDNGLDLTEFGHFRPETLCQLKHLPIDLIAHWKLGSVIMWNRCQLHTSTNFARFGVIKKFIVLFIA